MVGAADGWQNAGKESAIMAKQRYSKEYQDEACKLVVEQGCSQKQTAHKLGVSIVTLREWLKKRDLLRPMQLVEPDYESTQDPALLKARIRELEKRLARSETEKEILKKATAYFASQSH
jgi:transposase